MGGDTEGVCDEGLGEVAVTEEKATRGQGWRTWQQIVSLSWQLITDTCPPYCHVSYTPHDMKVSLY